MRRNLKIALLLVLSFLFFSSMAQMDFMKQESHWHQIFGEYFAFSTKGDL